MKIQSLLIYCLIYFSIPVVCQAQGDTTKGVKDSTAVTTVIKSGTPQGPSGKVKGTITDEKDKQPIPGVGIQYDNKAGGTVTDLDGNYELLLPVGPHTIEYSFVGYETITKKVKVAAEKEQKESIALSTIQHEIGIVTVTDGKHAKDFGSEISSIEVVRPGIIENSNSVSLDKVLDKVPGVNMIGEQINIRGGAGYSAGSASRVLMLVDDLPMLTPDDATIEMNSMPLENVEQIEVVKGASSALYGSSALNGIINLRTADARSTPYTKLTVFYGFYENPFSGKNKKYYWDRKRPMFGGATFAHRKKYKNLDVVLGGAYSQDKSYLASNSTKHTRFNIKLRYHPEKVPGLSFGINANFANNDGDFFFLWAYPGYLTPDSVKNRPGYIDSLRYTSGDTTNPYFRSTPINFDPFITYFDKHGGQHSIKGRLYYVASLNSNNQKSNATLYYGEYNYNNSIKKWGVNVVTGVVGSFSNISSETFGNRKSRNGAAFLQLEKKFFNRLTLSLGVRTEMTQLDTLKLVVKPIVRSGVNFKVTSTTFIRASFGQGYRYPSIAEKFVTTTRSGIKVIPNPAVNPESSWSAELGAKQAFKIAKDWVGYLDVAGFITQYKNMIEFNPIIYYNPATNSNEFAFQAQNVTDARISGFEVSAIGTGKIKGYPVNFLLGYNYLVPIDLNYDKAKTPDRNNMLNYRFRHSAKGDVETTIKHVILGVTATYTSFMVNIDPKIAAVNGIEEYRKQDHTGNIVLDARMGYSLNEGTRLSFIAKNVLNNHYTTRPGYFEAPRNYTVQLSYQF